MVDVQPATVTWPSGRQRTRPSVAWAPQGRGADAPVTPSPRSDIRLSSELPPNRDHHPAISQRRPIRNHGGGGWSGSSPCPPGFARSAPPLAESPHSLCSLGAQDMAFGFQTKNSDASKQGGDEEKKKKLCADDHQPRKRGRSERTKVGLLSSPFTITHCLQCSARFRHRATRSRLRLHRLPSARRRWMRRCRRSSVVPLTSPTQLECLKSTHPLRGTFGLLLSVVSSGIPAKQLRGTFGLLLSVVSSGIPAKQLRGAFGSLLSVVSSDIPTKPQLKEDFGPPCWCRPLSTCPRIK
jgi:hypothetical protein